MKLSNKIEALIEQIGNLTMQEAADMANLMETKWGIKANQVQPTQAPVQEKAEASLFDVNLIGYEDSKKISVIKAVRAYKDMGLLEAKNFVEGCTEKPQELKSDIDKAEADKIKSEIEAAGGKIEVK